MAARGFTVDPAHYVGRKIAGGVDTITFQDGTTATGIAGPVFVGHPAALTDGDEVGLANKARGVEGILNSDTANGDRAAIQTQGRTSITVDAAYSIGDELTAEDDTGKATVVGVGDVPFVRLLEASAADGDVVECDIIRPMPWAPVGV